MIVISISNTISRLELKKVLKNRKKVVMELSSSHIKKMKNDEKEEHSRRLSTELFGPGTITLGSKQKSELITGAKRLMTDDFGSVPLKRSASTTMEAMPLMTRREIARVASAFANEIDVLPTTEQRRLYNVLSDSSHRPTERMFVKSLFDSDLTHNSHLPHLIFSSR